MRKANAKRLLQMAKTVEREKAGKRERDTGRRAAPLAAGEDQARPPRWLVVDRPDVRFVDVAGLEEAKRAVVRMVIYPFKHPQTADRFRKKAGGGVLLYGPPGTGKSLFARAIAGELQAAAFFSAKCSDIMSKWVGEAEQNIADLFTEARSYGTAVVFIDEIEAIVASRDTNSTVMKRVIPEFLQQWQGLKEEKASLLLVGATNRPWDLDEASLRPGRFDRLVYVGLPDLRARRQILDSNLKGVPMAPEIDLGTIAERLEGYSGADVVAVCERATDAPYEREIATGKQCVLAMDDLISATHEVKPSVSPRMLKRYESFMEERGAL